MDPTRPPAGMRRGLAAAVATTTGSVLPVFLVGALAVEIRAGLHFGPGRLGILIAVYYLTAAISSIPFGHLVEAVGGSRVMKACPIAAAAVMVAIAVVVGSWAGLVAAMIPAGLASSASQPSANQFISRTVPATRQGTAFGIKQAAIPLASLMAGLAVPAVALTVGWRWAFAGAAVVAVATVLLVPAPALSLRERRARARAERAGRKGTSAALVVLAAAFALGLVAASTLGAFLVTSAVESGMSRGDAGLVAALASAAGLIVRLVVGVLADRRGGRHFPVVAGMLTVGAAGYVLLAAGAASRSALLFVPGAVIAFASGWGWNGLYNFAVVRTHPDRPAAATAVTQTGGRLGSVVGPLLFGFVAAHASYTAGWSLDAGVALLAAAGMIIGRRLLLRERSREGAT